VSLGDPIPPLTPPQRRLLVVSTVLIAIGRALSMAASPWDWDEMQFLLALRDYDVLFHRPHPPGFPLYIGAAKLLQLLGLSDFHALQAWNLIGGSAIFPAALLAFREMRFPLRTAAIGASIVVFFPNLWFFGGTAFSDVPSLALALIAVALLFRGCRNGAAYVGGAIVLAAAAGVRPQNLLIGAAPLLIATWYCIRARRWPALAAGALGGFAVLAATYGAAASITGWARYFDAVEMHRRFIAIVDTGRVPLRATFDDFFFRPYRAPLINAVVALLAFLGILRSAFLRSMRLFLALVTFGPFAVAAWLFLDPFSASRFSIGYAPLIAAATAEGIATVRRRAFEIALAGALVMLMIVWTAPAVLYVRRHQSPPAAAMRWIARHVDPRKTLVYVHESVLPFAWYYLPEHSRRDVHDASPPRMRMRDAYLVAEGDRPEAVARFVWPHGRLWDLVRRRYFVMSVAPTSSRIEFGAGWYGPESAAMRRWRWMGSRSTTRISTEAGAGELRLRFDVPTELLARSPQITIRWNGQVIERFKLRERPAQRTYRLAGPGELILETTAVMNLAREGRGSDPRDLGLMVHEIRWRPGYGLN
jgi:hypothetical protein